MDTLKVLQIARSIIRNELVEGAVTDTQTGVPLGKLLDDAIEREMPRIHEYLTPAGKGDNCRACGLPRNHVSHSLPDVQVSIGPMRGAFDPPQFSIQIKDGTTLIARVYLSAEDFALALSGRMVIAKLAPRYKGPA